jgi:hypothetical protein
VPTKPETVILIKVKSYYVLLRMLLVCISIYLTPVLKYQLLIMEIYHLDTLYTHQQECEDLWLFCEATRGPQAKMFGKRN